MKHEIRPLNFAKQHNRLFPQKKKVDFHPSWTFVWRSEEFTKLGDPRSLIPTSDDRSGKTLGAKKAKNCSRYLILAWTWFIAIVILHNRKGLTAHERNISDKKSSLWPDLDLSAKSFSPFWFFLEYLLSDLEEVEDIIRFSQSSSKTKVWFNEEFLRKMFCLQTCGWLNFCKWSSLFW